MISKLADFSCQQYFFKRWTNLWLFSPQITFLNMGGLILNTCLTSASNMRDSRVYLDWNKFVSSLLLSCPSLFFSSPVLYCPSLFFTSLLFSSLHFSFLLFSFLLSCPSLLFSSPLLSSPLLSPLLSSPLLFSPLPFSPLPSPPLPSPLLFSSLSCPVLSCPVLSCPVLFTYSSTSNRSEGQCDGGVSLFSYTVKSRL